MIKNILFDFGGVLLDIDYRQTDIHMGKLYGLSEIFIEPFKSIMEEYEVGHFDERAFLDKMQKEGVVKISDQLLLDSFNSMLGPIPIHRLELLSKLKSKYRLFLLSNTNETHLRFVRKYLLHSHGITDFETRYFEKVYYSHEIQRRKPNQDIYDFVLRDAGIEASETLFLDDSKENIAGAKVLGIQGIVHDRKVDIVDVIQNYLTNISN